MPINPIKIKFPTVKRYKKQNSIIKETCEAKDRLWKMFAEHITGRGLIGFMSCQLDEIIIPKKNMQTAAKDRYQYIPNYAPCNTNNIQFRCLIGKDECVAHLQSGWDVYTRLRLPLERDRKLSQRYNSSEIFTSGTHKPFWIPSIFWDSALGESGLIAVLLLKRWLPNVVLHSAVLHTCVMWTRRGEWRTDSIPGYNMGGVLGLKGRKGMIQGEGAAAAGIRACGVRMGDRS